jgi:Coenzyme Q (ubiquinone) biosynthesis protein Coq4
MALKRLYPNHLPTGTFSRLVLTAGSGLGAFMFPQRADLVAAFGELTGADAFKRIHERMQQDPTGQLLLREKPIVTVRAFLCSSLQSSNSILRQLGLSSPFDMYTHMQLCTVQCSCAGRFPGQLQAGAGALLWPRLC